MSHMGHGSRVRTVTGADVAAEDVADALDEVAAEDVADALDEVALGSAVEPEVELSLDVVVVPGSEDVVVVACPFADVWSGGAAEPMGVWLLGVAMTESVLPPEVEAGGGGDWPDGRTTYVHSLSSRTCCVPLLSVSGVRVTLQVCVIVPT